jgi:hypothetical protein
MTVQLYRRISGHVVLELWLSPVQIQAGRAKGEPHLSSTPKSSKKGERAGRRQKKMKHDFDVGIFPHISTYIKTSQNDFTVLAGVDILTNLMFVSQVMKYQVER